VKPNPTPGSTVSTDLLRARDRKRKALTTTGAAVRFRWERSTDIAFQGEKNAFPNVQDQRTSHAVFTAATRENDSQIELGFEKAPRRKGSENDRSPRYHPTWQFRIRYTRFHNLSLYPHLRDITLPLPITTCSYLFVTKDIRLPPKILRKTGIYHHSPELGQKALVRV